MKQIFRTLFFVTCAICAIQVNAQPLIGISSTAKPNCASAPIAYIKAVRAAGGVPLVIPITSDSLQLSAVLDRIDGLVLTGGEDINPANYGQKAHHNLGELAPKRDTFDLLLIKMATRRNVPILGVCRGHQALNVAFGGTLYQDIPNQIPASTLTHRQTAPDTEPAHEIMIDEKSLLYGLIGSKKVNVNSLHHQSVRDIAPVFVVVARASDGVVEAMEHRFGKPIMGVQFHPEAFVASGDTKFIGVFRWLVNEADGRRTRK